MTSAIEEIFCWNLQVPEFWDFEISCWHKEVLSGNEYICNFWVSIYTLLAHWFHNENMLNLSNQWELAIPFSGQSGECLHKKSNQSDCFPSREGKWSDWLRVICFVFKTVVPKHRFCKLQNVWNVCEFGSDYMAPWVNIIDSLNMTLSYIGAIYS